MLPSLQLLEKVSQEVMSIPNKRKESKRRIHYGLFLLGYKSGLRVNEAVKFDLDTKTKKGLYRIEKPKGKSERLVYVSKKVIGELKANNWQPNQTNRWNFYHFLKKVKKELGISKSVELTPHTLRRSFTTYHAEAGLPLPLLQKLLGHSSIRTTALYWRNIYSEDDNGGGADTPNILAGKKWLENREKEPPQLPNKNFPKQSPLNLEPVIRDNPLITAKQPIQQTNPPLLTEISEKPLTNYQPKPLISKIPTASISQKTEISEQSPTLTNQKEQKNHQENFLLAKIRKLEVENNNLKAVVQSEKQNNQSLKETITNLTHKFHAGEQNHANLINAYQKALNDKAEAEKQVNYYQDRLKTIAKSLYQWSKINYYQQLEQEQEAKIEQSLPFKPNK